MILVENPHQLLNGNNKLDIKSNEYNHDYYMGYALQLAAQALAFNEVPVGSVVVCNDTGNIVGMGHNRTISTYQTCMHAEMIAINNACDYFKNYRLPNCRIYITLEPCAMCAGAIIHSRLSDVIFSSYDYKTGMAGSLYNLFELSINHHTKVLGGIKQKESKEQLQSFFRKKRQLIKINKLSKIYPQF